MLINRCPETAIHVQFKNTKISLNNKKRSLHLIKGQITAKGHKFLFGNIIFNFQLGLKSAFLACRRALKNAILACHRTFKSALLSRCHALKELFS